MLVFYFLLCLTSAEGLDLFGGSLISMYKNQRLPFREDVYLRNLPIVDSYDYVIVGAGPSGCVLANRLSADPTKTVLLLEAGGEPNLYSNIPILNLLMYETEYNWKFHSQYNPGVCRALEDETCPWPSGKGIGGGSIFNAMIFTRGNRWEYDSWAKSGNKGWSYDELVKYWKRVERLQERSIDTRGRGTNGSVFLEYPHYRTTGAKVFIEAGKELGLPEVDYNQPYDEAISYIQFSLHNGQRYPAGDAYLTPAATRKNLHIAQKTYVSRIIIDPTTKTATGVEYTKKGRKRSVAARKQVILSAGAFGSPKVLMLSGIGHRQHLESLGIPVIADLPVGDNLIEHIGSNYVTFFTNRSDFNLGVKDAFPSFPMYFAQYMTSKTGFMTTPGCEALAYFKSKYATDNIPDVELIYAGFGFSDDYGKSIRKTIGIRDDVYEAYWKPLEGKNLFGMWVMGCYPKSRGTLRLSSSDPKDPPVITNNFLSDERDLQIIVEGIKKVVEFSKTKAMKAYGAELYTKPLPGCEMETFGSDEYWACTVRQITTQWHHQCGTCKMGPDEDPTAVVDPSLRVKGIKNLRVADMSIAPTIPAGHTMSPAYMIGEKAADLILKDK